MVPLQTCTYLHACFSMDLVHGVAVASILSAAQSELPDCALASAGAHTVRS